MNRIRRIVAAMLAIVLVYGVIGGSFTSVSAAEIPVTITVEKYENGILQLQWSNISGGRAAVIAYHTPDNNDKAVLNVTEPILEGNSASISGLEADYIYDICVVIYGAVDEDNKPVGSPIGRGLLFYLPAITFTSSTPAQPYETVEGGGREIGGKPKLKLNWRQPKVFNDPNGTVYPDDDGNLDNNTFVQLDAYNSTDYNNGLAYMKTALNKVYDDNRDVSTLNYRINLSTELRSLNSGSDQASILIEKKAAGLGYEAMVSGTEGIKANVSAPNAAGFISLELLGKADEDALDPVFDPSKDYVLPNGELLPGTVYYMNIKPVFRDGDRTEINAVFVGSKGDQNGSMLSGERTYASTPIRFQITKDSANNIYIKIYKINQGSLNLPRLYYEVQATDTPSMPGDWEVKKTMDDSYFSGTSAITVISGVNPNNEIYYKIVVKSESPSDRLESLPMPYQLTIDTSRPPLPTGIAVVNRVLNTQDVLHPNAQEIQVKSTDVTLSWEKPLNWNEIKDNLYFHLILNTNQTEITSDVALFVDGTYWDSYPAKYRLVKYISAKSPNIEEMGNRLTYTINAFDLFKWEDENGEETEIPNPENYPSFLLPNTVYYLQMYTTTDDNKGTTDAGAMSDRSIVTSFTTLNGVEIDVPLPGSFELSANGKDTTQDPVVNYIDLTFDKVSNIHWNNYTPEFNNEDYSYETYYDFYMNTRTDTEFTLLGTTEKLNEDVGFTGVGDPQSTSIRARISQFAAPAEGEPASEIYTLVGGKLLPNTTYYFKIRTRLVIRNKADSSIVMSRDSIDTAILPVTTIVLGISPPDDNLRKPLAPTDFDIAVDAGTNQLLSGNSVTFSWEMKESDVIYELIRTSRKVGTMDRLESYNGDPEYLSFLQEYDILSDGTNDGKVYLDPLDITHTGKLTYDHATKICTYTVDRRMFPNKLYYFSLKAVRVNNQRDVLEPAPESVWVSIPVTTSLIEAPTSLEVVLKAELGIYWTDNTVGLTADDFRIYAKGPKDADYKLMTRARATIVKDKDGRTYYGRISGLDLDSYYDVKVAKGSNTVVYNKTGLKTRDGYHELEVKWAGKPLDNYSRYDIAIMAEGEAEYTVLSPVDLEQYVNMDGSIAPYYTEETASTINSDKLYYYAKIKSFETELPGGIMARQPLRSNVKYYVKVRAVKIDPTETDLIAYSKYIGPVSTRTEFNQEDYDNTDREEQQRAVFLDRMEQLEKGYYWRVSIGDSRANVILLKGDRVSDALSNTPGDTFTVDMTEISVNINTDEVYVPLSVIRTMNSKNKSLLIRTSGSELIVRPSTLNASDNRQLKEIMERQGVKDLYVKLGVSRTKSTSTSLPTGTERVSDINVLNVQAYGLSRTDKELKTLFHDKLYDSENGLVIEKLNMLLNTYAGTGTAYSETIDKYTRSLIEMIERELSYYIDSTISTVRLSSAIRNIADFETPVSIRLSVSSSKGVKTPYALYQGENAWSKISLNTADGSSGIRFNISGAAAYVILATQSKMIDVPSGHWAEDYIVRFTSKYELSDVFSGINYGFMPENIVTCREVVLLYEKVVGKASENAGLDIRQKNTKLGLSGIINANSLPKSVKRQETAAVLLKLFSVKKGVSISALRPNGRVDIADERDIGTAYINHVEMIVDMAVMSLSYDGSFYPNNQMTRAEVITAFVRLLEKTGEL